MIDIDAILRELVNRRGSDLHLKVNRPPLMRISSDLLPSEFPPLSKEDMEAVLRKLVGDRAGRRWRRNTRSTRPTRSRTSPASASTPSRSARSSARRCA
jgi:Tfp pilus assembly pilus retraction ATPase PilT